MNIRPQLGDCVGDWQPDFVWVPVKTLSDCWAWGWVERRSIWTKYGNAVWSWNQYRRVAQRD